MAQVPRLEGTVVPSTAAERGNRWDVQQPQDPMRVELRKGRAYLYSRKRVNGRVRCEYLGPLSPNEVAHFRGRAASERAIREIERREREAEGERIDALLAVGISFDELADRVFRAVMYLSGYTLHNRGEWRRKRRGEVSNLADIINAATGHRPALVTPPVFRAEDRDILDRAARGDWSALPQVRELLKDQDYRDAIGGAGEMGLTGLVASAAGDNIAVAVAMKEKYDEYVTKLLADGPEPTFAERMAATRAAHNWLAVHILECMAATRQPASSQAVAIERRVTQAERRLHAALKSLAVLRRLRKPVAVTQVNIAKGGPMVVNNGAQGETKS